MGSMQANALMKYNVSALLRARGLTQKDLAQWCRRSQGWISKILKEDRREFPMKYWDRIGDFFGIAAYQLLQPGIAGMAERRKGGDRRAGRDRRIATAVRVVFHDMDTDRALVHEMLSLAPDERQKLLKALADYKRKQLLGPGKDE